MGWGNPPHEGFAEQQRDDGQWTDGTWQGGWGFPHAARAACSCGWRGQTKHSLADRPEFNSARWAAYEQQAEHVDELVYAEWRVEHFGPMLGHDPSDVLILGRDDGGPRHFLGGRSVHAGTPLELLLPDGRWQPVVYEWGRDHDAPPTASMTIGGPPGAERLTELPVVSFELPPMAVLRWPERGRFERTTR